MSRPFFTGNTAPLNDFRIGLGQAAADAPAEAGRVYSAQGSDELLDNVIAVTPLSNGNVAIIRSTVNLQLETEIRMRIFDGNSLPISQDIVLDVPFLTPEISVAALRGGAFVVSFDYHPSGPLGLGFGVGAQVFTNNGNKAGPVLFHSTENGFHNSVVTGLEGGGFVVTWVEEKQNNGQDVYAQAFARTGSPIGEPVLVHEPSDKTQNFHSVVAMPDGGFAVVWHDTDQFQSDPNYVGSIQGQFFDASGAKIGDSFTVLEDGTKVYLSIELAALGNGSIAVGWVEEIDYDNGEFANGFQIVNAEGQKVGDPVPVSFFSLQYGRQNLAATADGGFVVTWAGINPQGSNPDDTLSWAQFFNFSGEAVGATFVVNDAPDRFESMAEVGTLESGDLVFSWTGLFQDNLDRFTTDAYALNFDFSDRPFLGSNNAETLYDTHRNDTIRALDGADRIINSAGTDTIDGGANVDTMVFSGLRSDYVITQSSTGVFEVVGQGGIDILTAVEFVQFDDQLMRLLPGTGVSVNFETADPSVYQSAMQSIRDFDGNALGGDGAWLRIGSADIDGDGDIDQILVNDAIGRFATVGGSTDGLSYFEDHGWAGETRVVGIYIDPLVQSGDVVAGSADDSQRRFQNDLQIENINRVLGADDYDGDGLQEVYFALTDGTAYLHAYMHADGNIRYANYQSQQQVIDFLAQNGFGSETYADWFA